MEAWTEMAPDPTRPRLEFNYLRQQIVGVDSTFDTPFGPRLLVYCDYTASGRCLRFVEEYLQGLQRNYANTHTEDDITGRSMTQLLHEAEEAIKASVNAGPHGRIVSCGTGATGAIDKWQQMVGVALPPVTRQTVLTVLCEQFGDAEVQAFRERLHATQPVVFVGPYEHHSNEVTWREGLCTVVEIGLTSDGRLDLDDLEGKLKDSRFEGRLRIGSFSAGSNVTGMRTPVSEVARLLHRYGAMACFDYAATGPYVEIDMSPPLDEDGGDPSLDAVFLSPHKFLGGPGSSGVLVFKDHLYRRDLPPTVGGGGTVDYVGYAGHDFIDKIEEREKAGTPGVLQILKAALAFEVKEAVGVERIEAREAELVERAFARWTSNPKIEILGNPDPTLRIAIVSFNLRGEDGSYLHPKFVTTLANDLFGIQSRAGCSCAGPYGHRLLGIDSETSERFRAVIAAGSCGIKPGWCRVGFHYVMDDAEADYVIEAIDFLAREGRRFLPLYRFDEATGGWSHRDEIEHPGEFSLQAALCATHFGATALTESDRRGRYRAALEFAEHEARRLASQGPIDLDRLGGEAGELQFFELARGSAKGQELPPSKKD